MPNGEVETTEENKYENAFWEWVEETYVPGDVDILRAYRDISQSAQWGYFLRNIYGLRPEHPDYPGPVEKPPTEYFKLTEGDWGLLDRLGDDPAKTQAELDRWVHIGYITEGQHRDIWNQVAARIRGKTAAFLATGYTEEEWPAEYERRRAEKARLKALQEVGPMLGAPAGVGGRAEALTRKKERRAREMEWERYAPSPRYEPAFEEERAGLEGTQPWRSWFERQYPSLVSRFKAQLPDFEARYYPGMQPKEAEEKIEKTWAEYLRKQKPKVREEWYGQTPYERGERPSAYAPRIQTVGF